MTTKFEVLYLTIFLSSIICYQCSELPKPTYTRTMLKVSRSLPGETEELKVRTSEGKLTTLIVKRKERPQIFENFKSTSLIQEQGEENKFEKPHSWTISNNNNNNNENDVRHLEVAQIQRIRAQLNSTKNESAKNFNTSGGGDRQIFEDRNKAIDYGNWRPINDANDQENANTDNYPIWQSPSSNDNNYNSRDNLVLISNFRDRDERKLNYPQDDKSSPRLLTTNNNAEPYAFFPHEPRPLRRTNIGANLMKNRDAKNVPPEVTITSELNVKSSPPKQSKITFDADGTQIIQGERKPDDPIDKIYTWRNARVINNRLIPKDAMSVTVDPSTLYHSSDNLVEKQKFKQFIEDVNRRYGRNFNNDENRNVYYEWEPKNYQNDGLRAENYEFKTDNYRTSTIQKRMLHPESVTTFPNSPIYTPESQKIAPLTMKPGARAPVLQYAHPELGVQPAKILKNEKRRPDNFPENQYSFTEQRHKKKYVLNDKNIVDSYTLKNYYPNQHFYGLKKPETPFWMKISENLKNQFSTGVERVSQFTKPVFDPLVEATHKISQNLGLSKGQEAQDKIGTVASSSSILIPALGLVASGAALGIGAVAVGRYLDVDVLKRSNENNEAEIDETRALKAISKFTEDYQTTDVEADKNNNVLLLLEEIEAGKEKSDKPSAELISQRRKRSLDLDIFGAEADQENHVRTKRFQRKGADLITEIVEIDVPAKGKNIDITELLIPKSRETETEDNSIVLVEDGSLPLGIVANQGIGQKVENNEALDKMVQVVDEIVKKSDENLSKREKLVQNSENRMKRRKRSLDSDQELMDAFQNLEHAAVAEVNHIAGDWTNTPCAKKMFCNAMIENGPDASIFMEKRMDSLLSLIQPGAAAQVSGHFEEVMEAVRRYDCSKFVCLQARPGNAFY